jgi:predicted nucleic acid-binding protein
VVLKKLKPYLVTAAGSSAEIIKTIDERKPPEKREYEKYLEELKKIGDLALLSPNLAWEKFTYFYTRLPLPLKKLVQEKVLPVAENSKLSDSLSLKLVINEVGLLLWGYFELSARHYKASLER